MADTVPPLPTPAPGALPVPPRKSKRGKIIRRSLLALVVLIVVAAVVLFFSLNTLVRWGVIRGGYAATKQDTNLDAANLSLAGGALQLSQLGIHNLTGYTSPNFLTMKSCDVTVQSSSIFTNTVVIDSIAIDGLEIFLEQNGAKNNLAEIIEQIKQNTAAADTGAAGSEGSTASTTPPGKQLKITKLTLTRTKVHIRASAPIPINLDIDLPSLSIDDPTNPDGRPMKIADLVGKILLQVSKQIIENPQIPGGIKDGMKNVQAIVNNLRGQLDKGVKQYTAQLQDVGKNLQDAVKNGDPSKIQDLGKDVGKNLQDAGKNFGNLLNPKKDDQK